MEFVNKKDNDEVNKALNIMVRVFFGLYWYFDNLVILKTVKFMKGEYKSDSKNGSTCWLIALLCSLVQNGRNLLRSFEEEQTLGQKILAS